MADRFEFVPTEGLIEDLQALHDRGVRNPTGEEARLIKVALNVLAALKTGEERGTHTLGYMSKYADMSDCETTYLGADPTTKSTHRLVWRELPPKAAGGLPRREGIVLGRRDDGEVYKTAGERLGREPGIRLTELPGTAEKAAGTRDTLKRVRDASRSTQQEAIQHEQSQVIGRGEVEREL